VPQHRTLEWLTVYGKRYPMAWELYANFQEKRLAKRKVQAFGLPGYEDVEDWPEWCWTPIAAAHAIVTLQTDPDARAAVTAARRAENVPDILKRPRADTGALAAVAAWRATQVIYRFDETVFEALLHTRIPGDIPVEVLKRMPTWCAYIETPSLAPLVGFYAWLEFDLADKHEELRFALDFEGAQHLIPMGVHLHGSIEEGLEAVRLRNEEAERNDPQFKRLPSWLKVNPLVEGLTSLVLFLCSDEAEVPPAPPKPDRVVVTKKGRTMTPAGRPRILECGAVLGAQLRRVQEERARSETEGETGRTVRGHYRAPHWHTFLTGPRTGEQKRVVKWLPLIRVNLPEDELPLPTIRPVKAK
jgi:hypothetical protein